MPYVLADQNSWLEKGKEPFDFKVLNTFENMINSVRYSSLRTSLTSQRRQHRSVHVGIFHDQETLRFWSSPSYWRYLYSVRSQHSRLMKMAILADHDSRKPDLCEWFIGSETARVSKRCDQRNRVFLLSY